MRESHISLQLLQVQLPILCVVKRLLCETAGQVFLFAFHVNTLQVFVQCCMLPRNLCL